jgi:hypothetical protein
VVHAVRVAGEIDEPVGREDEEDLGGGERRDVDVLDFALRGEVRGRGITAEKVCNIGGELEAGLCVEEDAGGVDGGQLEEKVADGWNTLLADCMNSSYWISIPRVTAIAPRTRSLSTHSLSPGCSLRMRATSAASAPL